MNSQDVQEVQDVVEIRKMVSKVANMGYLINMVSWESFCREGNI